MSQERGVATVGAVVVGTCLVVIAVVLTEMAGLVAMRHRAAAGSDLAALAASRASVLGDDACATARDTAARNRVVVERCRLDHDVATVTVRATSERWWGMQWHADVTARAAPETYLDPSP